MRTEQELKEIALDIHAGRIFTDRNCQKPDDIRGVFMPLALMEKKQLKDLQKQNPVMFFEYLKDAGPMAVNGMPIFMSFRFLNKEEFAKVAEYFKKITEAIDKI